MNTEFRAYRCSRRCVTRT